MYDGKWLNRETLSDQISEYNNCNNYRYSAKIYDNNNSNNVRVKYVRKTDVKRSQKRQTMRSQDLIVPVVSSFGRIFQSLCV